LTWKWIDEASDTVASTASVNTLASGMYTIEIRDRNNCLELRDLTIPEVAPILIDEIEVVPSKCFNTKEGSITLNASGGTGVFDPFSWFFVDGEEALSGNSNGNSETLDLLQRGTYEVTITDTNGCERDTTLIVESPPDFVLTTEIDTVDCFGEATGGVDITVGGATGPYGYEWFGTSVFVTDEDPTGLPTGEYAVRVTDAVGCITDSLVFVPQNAKIIPTLVAKDVACKNEASGSIEVLLQGGRPQFQFAWEQNGQSRSEDINLLSDLEPARYTVTITDRLGCQADTNYVVSEPEEEFIVDLFQDTICRDAFEPGTLSVEASGGVPVYSYRWDDGTTTSFNSLFAGDYTVEVSDQAGCVRTLDATVEEVTTFDIQRIDSSPSKCTDNASGSATISLENINYEFGVENLIITDVIWSGLPEEKGLTTNMLKGEEWHFVELIDQFGCSAIDSVFIENPPAFEIFLVSH